MCEQCMHLIYDEEIDDYVCGIAPIMDEDDFGRMNYGYKKQCLYYKVGDEYTLVRKQN
ncbi:MAG: DUF6472 family protein [Cellulosilyticaceae bacterium]